MGWYPESSRAEQMVLPIYPALPLTRIFLMALLNVGARFQRVSHRIRRRPASQRCASTTQESFGEVNEKVISPGDALVASMLDIVGDDEKDRLECSEICVGTDSKPLSQLDLGSPQ